MCEVTMFQSLIGRLETPQILYEEVILLGFQSLIGRLETFGSWKSTLSTSWFQSLIGRLETSIQIFI